MRTAGAQCRQGVDLYMDIYCDHREASRARVRLVGEEGMEVSGSVRGPFCKYSRTLPTTFPIRESNAIIIDPCYWTPRLPFRYEVRLKVTDVSGRIVEDQFLWGLRWCVAHKTGLSLDGTGFVLRAVELPGEDVDLLDVRELSCGVMIGSPSDQFCDKASETGVMIVQTDQHSTDGLRELNRHPAVHFSTGNDAPHQDILPVSRSRTADTIQCIREEDMPGRSNELVRPAFVQRTVRGSDPSAMRRSCDRLQSDMATYGQFAGYLISADP